MDQTVSVKNKKQENDTKNEISSVEIQSDDEPPKKRTWTPAREEAWQKCMEGRKRYMETKKEVLEKESEEKSIKEKIRLELLKKKIREEIQAELNLQTNLPEVKKDEHECKSDKEVDMRQEIKTKSSKNPTEEQSDEEIISKKKKKRKVVYEEPSESSSEEEIIIRKKRQKNSKKKKYYTDSSDKDEEHLAQNSKTKRMISANVEPPANYFSRYSFV